MTYAPAAIENGIPGYFEIRNSDGMIIGNAITNDSPFEGCQPVTIQDAERNAKLWCAAPELLEYLEIMANRLANMIDEKEGKPMEDDEIIKAFSIIKKATI